MSEFEELIDVLYDLRVTGICTVAATAWLVYEIIITLDQEINHVWRPPWTIIDFIYVAIRYYSLGWIILNVYEATNTQLSDKFCGHFNIFQEWGTVVMVPLVDLLIIMRIYAIYGQSKKVAFGLSILWLGELASALVFIGVEFRGDTQVMPNPLRGVLPGCFSTKHPNLKQVIQSGAVVTAFQGIYLFLTLYKFFSRVRSFGWNLTPLLTVFFRDGTGYCLIILVLYLFVTLLMAFATEKLDGAGEVWLIIVMAITGGRLVLNIRDVAKSPKSDEYALTHFTSDITAESEDAPIQPFGYP